MPFEKCLDLLLISTFPKINITGTFNNSGFTTLNLSTAVVGAFCIYPVAKMLVFFVLGSFLIVTHPDSLKHWERFCLVPTTTKNVQKQNFSPLTSLGNINRRFQPEKLRGQVTRPPTNNG